MTKDTKLSELAEGQQEFLDSLFKARDAKGPKSFKELCDFYGSAPGGGDPQFKLFMHMLKSDETIGDEDTMRKTGPIVGLAVFMAYTVKLLNFMGPFADPNNLPSF